MSEHQEHNQQTVQADYSNVPEVHVDGLGGVAVRNGVAKMNFFTIRHNRSGGGEPQGALTLDISLIDLVTMTNGLNAVVAQFQQQGLLGMPPQSEPHRDSHEHNEHHHEHHN